MKASWLGSVREDVVSVDERRMSKSASKAGLGEEGSKDG